MSGIVTRADNVRLRKLLHERTLREQRMAQSDPHGGLLEFVRYFWHVLEPVDPFIEGWPLECMCAHLEAITRGETVILNGVEKPFNRFLANVPPGFMKSLLVNVFWPAWEWGPMEMPHLRYVAFSYAAELTERDNAKFRDLVISPAYREMWGHVFNVIGDGKVRVTNDKTGFKFASSFGGVGTGERGHRVLFDDPHKLKGTQETEDARQSVVTWFLEGMQNRLNDLTRDVIVTIMQRVHENDVSGAIQKKLHDEYCCLCIPMEYELGRPFSNYTGWNDGNDPREEPRELAWPDRYPAEALASFRRNAYLWAGQYQQNPVPRGGGLFKEDWWQPYEVPKDGGYDFGEPIFILASLDTAFKEKEENDYSALTVWAVYDDRKTGNRRIMMIDAWKKRLPLHGERVPRYQDEDERAYMRRAAPKWGLCEWVNFTCSRRRVHTLIIEDSARGHDANNELKRLFGTRLWGTELIPAKGDKWGRATAVVSIFTDEMVWAPGVWRCAEHGETHCPEPGCADRAAGWEWRDWVQEVINELSSFPRGTHDDLCLVGDTLIATQRGMLPIRDVVVGDMALTPIGWRRVIDAGCTGVRPVLIRGKLTGTSNHPVYVRGRGYVDLGNVTSTDIVEGARLCSLIRTIHQIRSSSTASPTGAWAEKDGITSANHQATPAGNGPRACTSPSGSITTASLCQRATKFIIVTATLSIAALRIWIAYRKVSTAAFLRTSTEKLCVLTSRSKGFWQMLGTGRQLAWNGTDSTRTVRSASQTEHPMGRDSRSYRELVPSAAKSSGDGTSAGCIAALDAARKSADVAVEMQPVFNLTVEEAHCYFANGWLVHNCDSVTMALNYLRRRGLAIRREERQLIEEDLARFKKPLKPLY